MNKSTSAEAKEIAHLEKLRTQIASDIALLHQKEANLREHEQRLRELISKPEHQSEPPAHTVHVVDDGLADAWEKYHRAHALLEAARRGLADDRLAFREREEELTAREIEWSRREAWLKVREAELEVKIKNSAVPKPLGSYPLTFSAGPFVTMKSLLARRG